MAFHIHNNPYLLFPSSRDWLRMLINEMPKKCNPVEATTVTQLKFYL